MSEHAGYRGQEPSVVEQFGYVPANEFASVFYFLYEQYAKILNNPARETVSEKQIDDLHAQFEPRDRHWILEAEAAAREGREPWYPRRGSNANSVPKGLQILSGFLSLPSGERIKVPPEITTEADIRLAEALGGFLPFDLPLTGELRYGPYLLCYEEGYQPRSRFIPRRPSVAAGDRNTVGHAWKVKNTTPYLKRIIQTQAAAVRNGALAGERAIEVFVRQGRDADDNVRLAAEAGAHAVHAAQELSQYLDSFTNSQEDMVFKAMNLKGDVGDFLWPRLSGAFRRFGLPIPRRDPNEENLIHFEVVTAQFDTNIRYLRDPNADLAELRDVHQAIEEEMGVASNFRRQAA